MSDETKPGCGRVVTMGHGMGARCGEQFYGAPFVCEDCQIRTLRSDALALADSLLHWQRRAERAEAENERLRALLAAADPPA